MGGVMHASEDTRDTVGRLHLASSSNEISRSRSISLSTSLVLFVLLPPVLLGAAQFLLRDTCHELSVTALPSFEAKSLHLHSRPRPWSRRLLVSITSTPIMQRASTAEGRSRGPPPSGPTRAGTATPGMRGRGKSGKQQVPATDPLPVMGNARFSPWMLDTKGSFEAWNLRYEPVRAQFSSSGFGLDVIGRHGVEPETGIFRSPSSIDIERMPSPHPLLDRLPTLDAFMQAKREAERPKTAPNTRSWVPRGPWPPPLTKLQVWNPVYGALIFENLPRPNLEEGEGGLTVGDLKRMVYERLLLPPTLTLTLSAYGRVLEDHASLEECGLANGAKLDLSTTLRRNPHQSLHRVRVRSTALRTRQLQADESTTVLDLKHTFASSLANSEHVCDMPRSLLSSFRPPLLALRPAASLVLPAVDSRVFCPLSP